MARLERRLERSLGCLKVWQRLPPLALRSEHDSHRRPIGRRVEVSGAERRRVDGVGILEGVVCLVEASQVAEAVANVRQVASYLLMLRAVGTLVQLLRTLLEAQRRLVAPILALLGGPTVADTV